MHQYHHGTDLLNPLCATFLQASLMHHAQYSFATPWDNQVVGQTFL
jgi:hypothetical protein